MKKVVEIINGTESLEWAMHKAESTVAAKQVGEIHSAVTEILSHTKHLSKLDDLTDAVTNMVTAIVEVKDKLLASATGRDQIPTDTVEVMVAHINKSANTLHKVYGIIIVGLMLILGYLLIGEKFGWIRQLH